MNWKDTVYSDCSPQFVTKPRPQYGDVVRVLIRMANIDIVRTVLLNYLVHGEEKTAEMKRLTACQGMFGLDDSHFDYYQYYMAELTIREALTEYYFTIGTTEGIYFYNQRGVTLRQPRGFYSFKLLADAKIPDWVSRSVFYQIFPDRFDNGDHSTDILDDAYRVNGVPTTHMQWHEQPREWHDVKCLDFYGGDLVGIERRIDYLKTLGVNALYVNPIFHAATSHRYDCVDYFNVDPALGGNAALASLTEALHREDIKIIVDVSVNHTGDNHKWFNRQGVFFDTAEGAYHNRAASEREYYFFDADDNYVSWWDIPSLPELNYQSAALRQIIYELPNSLFGHWLQPPYSIDGWRLDVANEMARYDGLDLSDEVNVGIRHIIKTTNAEAYLIGEDWIDPYPHVQGDHWDSAMNYIGCARPIRQFFGDDDLYLWRHDSLKGLPDITGSGEICQQIHDHLASLPYLIQNAQFNLLGSHDVYRFHTRAGIGINQVKGAVAMQFMLPGAPSIYYGDEIGLDGWVGSVEGCRFPMDWQRAESGTPITAIYKTLIDFKRNEPLLQRGSTRLFPQDQNTLMMTRFDHQGCVLLITTRAKRRQTIMFDSAIIGDVFSDGRQRDIFGETKQFDVTDQLVSLNLKAEETLIFRFGR